MTSRLTPALADSEEHDDIIYPDTVPFLLVHLACFAAFWTGVTAQALVVCIALYVVRMFVVTAGYHRYFSHRSFKTSRVFQFILGFLAQTSAQRGVLWWAAKHRHHHRHSDTELDVHSPRHKGFWYSHVGWIFTPRHDMADYSTIPDLMKYPELRWLDRNRYTPAAILAVVCFVTMGWVGLVVGFFWSTVLLYHGSFMINSLAHVFGKQRYVTGDDSRNNWFLAIFTLGEGWHNNHHAYQRSTRQGFRWYEFDGTFYILKAMSWLGIVWDLGEPPPDLVRNEHKLGKAVIEKVAFQLAHTFPVERIAAQVRDAWAQRPGFVELREKVAAGQARAEQALHDMHLPHVPSMDELREQFRVHFASTPSREEIVARAREIILQAVGHQVFAPALA
ncbi:MAG TPA: fatty acid desaturase [Gemmatimonadaceae bacterium]|nr:fatty acid desaturase [Gemmatimonadaceae bacterium]